MKGDKALRNQQALPAELMMVPRRCKGSRRIREGEFRMKKGITLLLVLLMLVGVAQAQQWSEGTSPSQPYTGVPMVDLTQEFGYLMLYPDKSVGVEHYCQKLCIYTPREDVKASDGTFYLCSESNRNGEIWSTAMNNTDAITVRPMTEDELIALMWGGGTCFEVVLPESLELGESYFVNMEEGCIVSTDGVKSPTIGGTDSWAFTLEGDYGISALQYRRPQGNGYEEGVFHPQAGDEIRFDLVLGGQAAMALVYRNNESVEFDETAFDQSGEVIGQITGENPALGVLFMDAQGNEVGRVKIR